MMSEGCIISREGLQVCRSIEEGEDLVLQPSLERYDRFHPRTKKRVGGTFGNLDNAMSKIEKLWLLSSRYTHR
jgi:hypothetical protein